LKGSVEVSAFTDVDSSVASAHKVNVTHSEEVEVAVDKVVSDFNGRLDVFIANSGIACMYPISLSLFFSCQKSNPGPQCITIYPLLCFASHR